MNIIFPLWRVVTLSKYVIGAKVCTLNSFCVYHLFLLFRFILLIMKSLLLPFTFSLTLLENHEQKNLREFISSGAWAPVLWWQVGLGHRRPVDGAVTHSRVPLLHPGSERDPSSFSGPSCWCEASRRWNGCCRSYRDREGSTRCSSSGTARQGLVECPARKERCTQSRTPWQGRLRNCTAGHSSPPIKMKEKQTKKSTFSSKRCFSTAGVDNLTESFRKSKEPQQQNQVSQLTFSSRDKQILF